MTTTRLSRIVLVTALAALLAASCAPATFMTRAARSDAAASPAVDHEAELVYEQVARHSRRAADDWRVGVADAVVGEARAAGVDPLLVAAIVAHESSFRTRAVSSVGAVGLMQLRPFVARDVATRADVEWQGRETLHDPRANVRLGVRYLEELLELFDGDHRLALAAYNAGPTRVRRSAVGPTFVGSGYADRVLATWARLDATRATRSIAERDAASRS